ETMPRQQGSSPLRPWPEPRPVRGPRPSGTSLSQYLNEHLAVAGAIELDEEDALPLSQLQLAVDDRDGLGCRSDQRVLAVGVSVGELVVVEREVLRPDGHVVVPVLLPGR